MQTWKKRSDNIPVAVYLVVAVMLVFVGMYIVILGYRPYSNFYSYTKAICLDNYCFDVYVECFSGNMNVTKITDVIFMGDEWVDPRSDSERKINCVKL